MRLEQNARPLRAAFTGLVHRLEVSPPVLTAGRGEAAEAVAAMGEAAAAARPAAGHVDARAVAVAGGGGGVARPAAGGGRTGPAVLHVPASGAHHVTGGSLGGLSQTLMEVPMSAYDDELAARAARAVTSRCSGTA